MEAWRWLTFIYVLIALGSSESWFAIADISIDLICASSFSKTSISRPVNQSINQSIHQSVNHLFIQLINPSVCLVCLSVIGLVSQSGTLLKFYSMWPNLYWGWITNLRSISRLRPNLPEDQAGVTHLSVLDETLPDGTYYPTTLKDKMGQLCDFSLRS